MAAGCETETPGAEVPPSDKKMEEEGGEIANEEQLSTIQGILEELLSKRSLEEDGYIQQHMDAQLFVPLCILAGHRSIQSLGPGADVQTLLKIAKRSDKLAVNEDALLVKPLMKSKRNTLILHDLPEGIKEEELRELFKGAPGEDALTSVKPDVNHTAYVTFETDEDTQNVALWLRSQKLRGAMIRVNVKSEHFVRSFFPAQPPPGPNSIMSPALGPVNPGKGGMASPWMQPHGKGKQMVWRFDGWGYDGNGYAKGYDGKGYEGKGYDTGYDAAAGAEAWAGDPSVAWQPGADGAPEGMSAKGKGEKGKKGKGKGKGKFVKGAPMMGPGDVGQMEAMMAQGAYAAPEQQDVPVEGEEEGDAEVGYVHEFRKYSRQQIIEVCSTMGEVTKPESFAKFEKDKGDCGLFRQSPYKDWAPLPTPMISFASSVLEGGGEGKGERRRKGGKGGNEAEQQDEPAEESGGGRKEGGAWGKKDAGKNEGEHGEEAAGEWEEGGEWGEDWGEWPADDGSWGAQGAWKRGVGSSRRGRSASASWYGSSGPHWVEKGTAAANAEWEGEGDGNAWPSDKWSAWGEKAKSGGGQSSSKWQVKTSKAEEGEAAAPAPTSSSAAAGEASAKSDVAGAAGGGEGSTDEQSTATKTPSWADRVRASR
mmetsp:Transcript_3435/g.8958  ORF Transcript_3435/g.8958 Transcript_3435/m.8958 type:complete len:649 (-) Transcript_3435:493-2439(-)